MNPFEKTYTTESMSWLADHMQRSHDVVACLCNKGYTNQQLIARKAINAAYNLLQREWGSYSQRKKTKSFKA